MHEKEEFSGFWVSGDGSKCYCEDCAWDEFGSDSWPLDPVSETFEKCCKCTRSSSANPFQVKYTREKFYNKTPKVSIFEKN